MGNKGQGTGDMNKGCMVLDETRHIIHETLSCYPNPHDDLDDLIPEEPEEIDRPCH